MKKLFIFALIISFSFSLFSQVSQEEKKPDFRKAFWGMSQEEVKKLETEKPIHENEETILYNDNLFGIDCIVGYAFLKNKLARGVYLFSGTVNEHSNKTDYLNDYENIKSKVIEKYGKPKDDKTVWKDDLYKNDPSEWGMAISIGHLIKYCAWERPGSNINLEIYGDNYDITLRLSYSHPDFDKMKKEADKEKEGDKF